MLVQGAPVQSHDLCYLGPLSVHGGGTVLAARRKSVPVHPVHVRSWLVEGWRGPCPAIRSGAWLSARYRSQQSPLPVSGALRPSPHNHMCITELALHLDKYNAQCIKQYCHHGTYTCKCRFIYIYRIIISSYRYIEFRTINVFTTTILVLILTTINRWHHL